jgi:hypothetical protein
VNGRKISLFAVERFGCLVIDAVIPVVIGECVCDAGKMHDRAAMLE